jgi:hypothetical protein
VGAFLLANAPILLGDQEHRTALSSIPPGSIDRVGLELSRDAQRFAPDYKRSVDLPEPHLGYQGY